jgi:hypothetical protein
MQLCVDEGQRGCGRDTKRCRLYFGDDGDGSVLLGPTQKKNTLIERESDMGMYKRVTQGLLLASVSVGAFGAPWSGVHKTRAPARRSRIAATTTTNGCPQTGRR